MKVIGVMIPNAWKKNMFQTTNQLGFEIPLTIKKKHVSVKMYITLDPNESKSTLRADGTISLGPKGATCVQTGAKGIL